MTAPARRKYDWDAILAKAKKQPGRWLLDVQLINAPARIASSIRLRRHRKLRLEDGTLEASVTNRYTDDDGVDRATVWLRFTPSDN